MISIITRYTVAVIALAMTPLFAQAATIDLFASIDGAQANAGAGTGSLGTGTAIMTLDDQTLQFAWEVSYSGLSGPATAAHFHGPALPDQNAGVQVGIGVVSNPAIGSTMLSAAQASDLLAGLWYVNVHTTAFSGGEIRGQVQVVPVPAAIWLLLSGLLAGFGVVRRSK